MRNSLLPALLALDSLVAGLLAAPLLRRRSSRVTAALLFGAADATASLLGAVIAAPPHGLLLVAPGVPAVYGLYLVAVSVLAARGLRIASAPGRATALPALGALAVALSVDNLVAGGGASVVAAGIGSAALMLLGLTVGGRVIDGLPDTRRGVWAGAGLVVMACLAVAT